MAQTTIAEWLLAQEKAEYNRLMDILGDENPRDYEEEDYQTDQHERSVEGIQAWWN